MPPDVVAISQSSGARDRREGGQWSLPQRVKNDVLFVVIVCTLAVAERLPRALLRVLGRAIARVAFLVVPSQRRSARANLLRAYPERSEREREALLRRVYREIGTQLGDVVATLDPRRTIEPLPFLPGSRECLEDAIAEGRGVVFASAHLGPWERVAASLVLAKVPLTVVAREPYDPRLERVYDRLRGGRGVRAIYRGKSGAAMSLVRVLRTGGVLGIPMDLRSRVPSIDVSFLGSAPAPTAVGPARLALRTGAAVVVGTVAPLPREGAEARTHEPIGLYFTRLEASGRTEAEITQAINDELSRRIRAMPEAWLWMHDRFS